MLSGHERKIIPTILSSSLADFRSRPHNLFSWLSESESESAHADISSSEMKAR